MQSERTKEQGKALTANAQFDPKTTVKKPENPHSPAERALLSTDDTNGAT